MFAAIYGGEDASIKDFPYHVTVEKIWQKYGSSSILCQGAVLNDRWIVTLDRQLSGYYSPNELQVRAGTSQKLVGGSIHKINKVVNFDEYSTNILLMRVEEPFKFDENLQPIKIFGTYDDQESSTTIATTELDVEQESSTIFSTTESMAGLEASTVVVAGETNEEVSSSLEGRMANVTGFGKIRGSEKTEQLQWLEVPVVESDLCEPNNIYPKKIICTGYYGAGGKNVCRGDDASPLVIDGRLAGLAHNTFKIPRFCDKSQKPIIFTDISAYRDKIEEHIQEI